MLLDNVILHCPSLEAITYPIQIHVIGSSALLVFLGNESNIFIC
jgi:hypothetical protein